MPLRRLLEWLVATTTTLQLFGPPNHSQVLLLQNNNIAWGSVVPVHFVDGDTAAAAALEAITTTTARDGILQLGVSATFEVQEGKRMVVGSMMMTQELRGEQCWVAVQIDDMGRVGTVSSTCSNSLVAASTTIGKGRTTLVNLSWKVEPPLWTTRVMFILGSLMSGIVFVMVLLD